MIMIMIMTMIPIEIVNKILVYVSQLNNTIIITQYRLITNKEYYNINFNNDLLWKIKATLLAKRFYPIYDGDFSKGNIELYKCAIPYYEEKLRLKLYK